MAVQHLDIIKIVLADILKHYDVTSPGWLTRIISEYRALFPAPFENFVKSFDFDPSAEENRRVKSFISMPNLVLATVALYIWDNL